MDPAPWADILEDAAPGAHVALVYRDEDFLVRAVAAWSEGTLRAGGGVILVGTTTHAMVIRRQLRKASLDVDACEREGRLVVVDADWLMARFLIDGTPDAEAFRALVDEILGGVERSVRPGAEVRAWGEMVSILRLRGSPLAARRLEDLWSEIVRERGLSLLCSYDLASRRPDAHAAFTSDVAHRHANVLLQPEPHRGSSAVGAAGL